MCILNFLFKNKKKIEQKAKLEKQYEHEKVILNTSNTTIIQEKEDLTYPIDTINFENNKNNENSITYNKPEECTNEELSKNEKEVLSNQKEVIEQPHFINLQNINLKSKILSTNIIEPKKQEYDDTGEQDKQNVFQILDDQKELVNMVNEEFNKQVVLRQSEEIDNMISIIIDQEKSLNGIDTNVQNYLSIKQIASNSINYTFIEDENEVVTLIKNNLTKIYYLKQEIIRLKNDRVNKVFFVDKLIKKGNEITIIKYYMKGFLNIINISCDFITVQDNEKNNFNVEINELCEQVLSIRSSKEIIYINEEMYLEVIRNIFKTTLCISTVNIKAELPFKECIIKMHDKHIYHLFGYMRHSKYKYSESTKTNAIQFKEKINSLINSHLIFEMLIEEKINLYEMKTPIGQVMGDWLLIYNSDIKIALIIENEYPKSFLVFEKMKIDSILNNQIKHNIKQINITETYKNIQLNLSKNIQESISIKYYNIKNKPDYFKKIIELEKMILKVMCENERYFLNYKNLEYRKQWISKKENKYHRIQRDKTEEKIIQKLYLNIMCGDILIHTKYGKMIYLKNENNIDYFKLENENIKTFLHGKIPLDHIKTITKCK